MAASMRLLKIKLQFPKLPSRIKEKRIFLAIVAGVLPGNSCR